MAILCRLGDFRLSSSLHRLFFRAFLVFAACTGLGCQESEPEEKWTGIRITEPPMDVIHYEMDDSFLNVARYTLEFRNVQKATFSIYIMEEEMSTLLGSQEVSQAVSTDEVFTGFLYLGMRSERGTVSGDGWFQPSFISIASQGMLSGSRSKTLAPFVLDDSHQFRTNASAAPQTVSSEEQFIFLYIWQTGNAEDDPAADDLTDELGPPTSSFDSILADAEDATQYFQKWGDLDSLRERIADVDDRVFMVGTIRVE
jgi:hypothetical protein